MHVAIQCLSTMPLCATREDIHIIFCHNAVHASRETLPREVRPSTSAEPPLQPLSGEDLELLTANRDQEARLDIEASGFPRVGQEAFFDVRVLY